MKKEDWKNALEGIKPQWQPTMALRWLTRGANGLESHAIRETVLQQMFVDARALGMAMNQAALGQWTEWRDVPTIEEED